MSDTSSIPLLYGYIQKLQHINDSWEANFMNLSDDLIALSSKAPLHFPPEKIACYLLIGILFWCCFGWIYEEIESNIGEKSAGFDPEEFDYLSSNEAIPAKFNLIEAYIQMNDFESASKVLVEIIAQGNGEQRQQAMKILDDIS